MDKKTKDRVLDKLVAGRTKIKEAQLAIQREFNADRISENIAKGFEKSTDEVMDQINNLYSKINLNG